MLVDTHPTQRLTNRNAINAINAATVLPFPLPIAGGMHPFASFPPTSSSRKQKETEREIILEITIRCNQDYNILQVNTSQTLCNTVSLQFLQGQINLQNGKHAPNSKQAAGFMWIMICIKKFQSLKNIFVRKSLNSLAVKHFLQLVQAH